MDPLELFKEGEELIYLVQFLNYETYEVSAGHWTLLQLFNSLTSP